MGEDPAWPGLCSAATEDLGLEAPAWARPKLGTGRHGSGRAGSHPNGVPWRTASVSFRPRLRSWGSWLLPSVQPPLTIAGLLPGPPTGFLGPHASVHTCTWAFSSSSPLQGDLCWLTAQTATFLSFSVPSAHTQSSWTLLSSICVCRIIYVEVRAECLAPGTLW